MMESGSADTSPVRIGATFTTGTGEQARIRGITGNDVWVDVDDQSGRHVGTFRFPLTAVETALAKETDDKPLWRAAMEERSRRATEEASGPPQSPAPPTWQPPPGIPITNRPGPGAFNDGVAGIKTWWGKLSTKLKFAFGGGSVAALFLLGYLLFGGGGGAGSSTLDDWVASVCKVGTYSNRGGGLNNARASGFCMSPSNMPIMIGQYDSTFSAQSDAAMVPGATYAMVGQSDGGICMFLAVSAGSGEILRPLHKFGAVFGTS